MELYNNIKSLTEKYIENLKKIEELGEYKVSLNIIPIEGISKTPNSVVIDTKDFERNNKEVEPKFAMFRDLNKNWFNYTGKLTSTVK